MPGESSCSLCRGQIPAPADAERGIVSSLLSSPTAPFVLVSARAANTLLCHSSLALSASVGPTAASPPGTASSTREPFQVPPLSFKRRSPPWSLFFICHICHVASILHATLNKQIICPIVPSLRALFFPSILSAICHLLLNLSHPFSHLIIPSRLPPCLRPRYTKQPPPGPPSAFELSYLEGFLLSPLPLLTAWRSVSWMDMQLESECALQRILNLKPSQTESVYLRVATFPGAAGCIGSPHLVPCNRLIMFTTAALWWESSN